MIIDSHAHFYTEESGRSDWKALNQRRLDAGEQMDIDLHVVSILGTWGHRSPTYFPSPADVTHANERLLELMAENPRRVRGYCVVNPNFTDHAMAELETRIGGNMIGVKLAASRRANDALLDPIAAFAGRHHVPILQHVWQRRRKEWPGQEASDAIELVELARRHPGTTFILAHIGGGGDWSHSLRSLRGVENIVVELSGSGVDTMMLEDTVAAVGVDRMMWGSDVTMDTGWAKLRHLYGMGLGGHEVDRIVSGTALAVFPAGAFGR